MHEWRHDWGYVVPTSYTLEELVSGYLALQRSRVGSKVPVRDLARHMHIAVGYVYSFVNDRAALDALAESAVLRTLKLDQAGLIDRLVGLGRPSPGLLWLVSRVDGDGDRTKYIGAEPWSAVDVALGWIGQTLFEFDNPDEWLDEIELGWSEVEAFAAVTHDRAPFVGDTERWSRVAMSQISATPECGQVARALAQLLDDQRRMPSIATLAAAAGLSVGAVHNQLQRQIPQTELCEAVLRHVTQASELQTRRVRLVRTWEIWTHLLATQPHLTPILFAPAPGQPAVMRHMMQWSAGEALDVSLERRARLIVGLTRRTASQCDDMSLWQREQLPRLLSLVAHMFPL